MSAKRKPRAKQLGVTDSDYAALLALQGGGCAICGNPPKTRRLDVDHDHKTGRVRGLLCHRCNRALPAWVSRSWLYAAADYLGRFDRQISGEARTAPTRSVAGSSVRGDGDRDRPALAEVAAHRSMLEAAGDRGARSPEPAARRHVGGGEDRAS
jgi:Recombination endonuclease VII